MTLPTPNYYLVVGDAILDDVADVNTITCTYGRNNLADQPSPSTFSCTYSIRQDNPVPPDSSIGDLVKWAVDDPTAASGKSYVFIGYVTDVSQNISNWRNGNGLIDYTITATGPLTRLTRDALASGVSFAKHKEGDRIAGAATYSDWPFFSIATPGGYEVAADNKGGHTILEVMQTAAQSGMGLLYEDLEYIKYETYATRTARSNSFTLDDSQVLASSLGTTQSVTTIANAVNLTYGAGGASTGSTYTDPDSQTQFGRMSATRSTELHNVADANTQAQILLATRAYPRPRLSSCQINLENPAIDNALRGDLVGVRTGQRISVAVPNQYGKDFNGYVEGYTWNLGRNQRILTLYLSDYKENKPYTMWYNVAAGDTWATYKTSTTTWSDVI